MSTPNKAQFKRRGFLSPMEIHGYYTDDIAFEELKGVCEHAQKFAAACYLWTGDERLWEISEAELPFGRLHALTVLRGWSDIFEDARKRLEERKNDNEGGP